MHLKLNVQFSIRALDGLYSKAFKQENTLTLLKKLQAEIVVKPTNDSLDILKRISARMIGLASLYFPKVWVIKKEISTKIDYE